MIVIDELDQDPVLTAPGGRNDDLLETTTSTAPPPAPVIVGWSGNIDLELGTCWDEVPPSTTTTTIPTTTDETAPTTTTTEPPTTVTRTGPPPTTGTLPPRPAAVAVVDCTGPNRGRAYAVICLDERDGDLVGDRCGGEITEIDWPGGREVQRAGAAACLVRFEEVFGEDYIRSARETVELIPNQGVWELGRREVVCTATEPPPSTTTSTTVDGG